MLLAFNSQAQDFVKFNDTGINKNIKDQLVTITLPFEITEGYHIQSENESVDGSLPTEILFEDSDLYEVVSFKYTKTKNEILVLSQYEHNTLIDEFEVTVILKLKNNNSNSKLNGQLYYQACTDKQCLFPRTLNFQVSII